MWGRDFHETVRWLSEKEWSYKHEGDAGAVADGFVAAMMMMPSGRKNRNSQAFDDDDDDLLYVVANISLSPETYV